MRLKRWGIVALLHLAAVQWCCNAAHAQNYERYKPLNLPQTLLATPEFDSESKLPEAVEDDRVLVTSLDAIVIVDHADKIDTSAAIDSLEGIHYQYGASDSLVFRNQIRRIINAELGKPITLRQLNEISRDIILQYRKCKQPIVDVVIPEQRITTGTVHIVVIESRIGQVKVEQGCHFDREETSRWIACTRPGNRIYEPNIENDLFWLNQNPFRRVTVDFEKGSAPGTTDVIYKVRDQRPLRGYTGIDDSGVQTLNYGRFFAGAQYGNVFGRGGTLGYQYTTDEEFRLLHAHSLSFAQPINRDYSFQTFGSYATVVPMLDFGLSQTGESWQVSSILNRHLVRNATHQRNLSFGYDFKSTNNSLEFSQTTISESNADLFQLRFGFDDLVRSDIDQFRLFRIETFVGPGGGMTGANSADAFNTIRPGTSPDYVYGRISLEQHDLIGENWLLATRLNGQASSERLLFSETLGLGGFDTIRGYDQRAYNADHGWIANFEFGPKTYRWGCQHNPHSLRAFTFTDVGNGYIANPTAGEDAFVFALSTGIGMRYQLSDRIIARIDYGTALKENNDLNRSSRFHFGLTWIPGRRL